MHRRDQPSHSRFDGHLLHRCRWINVALRPNPAHTAVETRTPPLQQPVASAEEGRNRLGDSKSPYLQQHASNPVWWYEWGDEAFEAAKRENKPIFLSIGYATCHWCHVMERECFENEGIAEIMNEKYINVKVDCEERPDVNSIYMNFVVSTLGSGGHPLSVFCTPEGLPFVGATYIPPRAIGSRPGFPTLLQNIADFWAREPEKLRGQGQYVIQELATYNAGMATEEDVAEGWRAVLATGFEQLKGMFDPAEGGFSKPPKFPRPHILSFLLRVGDGLAKGARAEARAMVAQTLRAMCRGGMYDLLGGGFHRYSVDPWWHVPHFEKMLYDNALLAVAYTEGFLALRDPLYERIVRETLAYVEREMTDGATGAFYSAEDADSALKEGAPEMREGAFYVWKMTEIDRILSSAEIFAKRYGLEEAGNVRNESDPHGEFVGVNVLQERASVKEVADAFGLSEEDCEVVLAECCSDLLARRKRRPRPRRDDKILVAWNGLMISAFAQAAQAFGVEAYAQSAHAAAKFILENMVYRVPGPDGEAAQTDEEWPEPGPNRWPHLRLRRMWRGGASSVPAFADDYAYLIAGLLDLYECELDARWLYYALQLQAAMDETLWDDKAGGYLQHAGEEASLLLNLKEDYDGAEPAPNSVAARNLLRLAEITADQRYRERAEATFKAFGQRLRNLPGAALPAMLVALDFCEEPVQQVIVAGERGTPEFRAALRAVQSTFGPRRVVLQYDPDARSEESANNAIVEKCLPLRAEFLRESLATKDGKPTVYLCENSACQAPMTEPEEIARALAEPADPSSS
eukprot:tig00000789_g4106.t2